MNIETQQMFRTYVWSYFSQHSEQRLKAFNFYIVLCTVIIGAFAAIVSRGKLTEYVAILPSALPVFSFIFWKIDERTKMLINVSENALRYLDEMALKEYGVESNVLALVKQDNLRTELLKPFPLFSGFFSYTRCFRWVFLFITLLGAVGISICLIQ